MRECSEGMYGRYPSLWTWWGAAEFSSWYSIVSPNGQEQVSSSMNSLCWEIETWGSDETSSVSSLFSSIPKQCQYHWTTHQFHFESLRQGRRETTRVDCLQWLLTCDDRAILKLYEPRLWFWSLINIYKLSLTLIRGSMIDIDDRIRLSFRFADSSSWALRIACGRKLGKSLFTGRL